MLNTIKGDSLGLRILTWVSYTKTMEDFLDACEPTRILAELCVWACVLTHLYSCTHVLWEEAHLPWDAQREILNPQRCRTTDENTFYWQETVAAFRWSKILCSREAKGGVMPLWRDTKAFRLYDELVTQAKEFSLYKLQTKSIMDEPIIKWASTELPAGG